MDGRTATDVTPESSGWAPWEIYTHRPRRGEYCHKCPQCVDNYDRWCLLFGAVWRTVEEAFKERKDVAGLRILDETRRYFGVRIDEFLGVGLPPLLRLHPDRKILEILRQALENPPRIAVRRGRPEALDEQWIDWQVFREANSFVRQVKSGNGPVGWIGLAEVYGRNWSDLLFRLKNFWKIRPRIIRETKPSVEAIRAWMAGHDDEAGDMKSRLEVLRLTYRFVTYLRFLPDQGLSGDPVEFVLRNELAIERRIARARRRARRAQSHFSPVVESVLRSMAAQLPESPTAAKQ